MPLILQIETSDTEHVRRLNYKDRTSEQRHRDESPHVKPERLLRHAQLVSKEAKESLNVKPQNLLRHAQLF